MNHHLQLNFWWSGVDQQALRGGTDVGECSWNALHEPRLALSFGGFLSGTLTVGNARVRVGLNAASALPSPDLCVPAHP
jgi:hypothetical protein